MAIDRTVKFTVRLNMLNPAHVTINKVLNELNLDIFKSKNQFFIDAVTYYIENYGQEELTPIILNIISYSIYKKLMLRWALE